MWMRRQGWERVVAPSTEAIGMTGRCAPAWTGPPLPMEGLRRSRAAWPAHTPRPPLIAVAEAAACASRARRAVACRVYAARR
eukprot:4954462-Prymnesium_polylepis.2